MADDTSNKYLQNMPDDSDVRDLYDKIAGLKKKAIDPADLSDLDQAEQEAKQLYQNKANTNDWLSVAERVGNAAVRLGAANAGMKAGVDASHVDLGPGIDFNANTQQAQKDYGMELGNLNTQRARRLEDQKLQQQEAQQDYQDQLAATKTQGENARDIYNQKVKLVGEGQRDENTLRRTEAMLGAQTARLDNIQYRSDKRHTDMQDREFTQRSLQDLINQEKGAQRGVEAAQTLRNQLLQEPDLSSKNADKLKQKYGQLASQAGIDLDSVTKQLGDQETMRPSFLGGKSSSEEQADKAKILDRQVQDARSLLDGIRSRKQQIIQGIRSPSSSSSSDTAPAADDQTKAPPPPPKEPTDAQVQQYVKLYPQVGADAARDILRKRLNP